MSITSIIVQTLVLTFFCAGAMYTLYQMYCPKLDFPNELFQLFYARTYRLLLSPWYILAAFGTLALIMAFFLYMGWNLIAYGSVLIYVGQYIGTLYLTKRQLGRYA